VGSGLAEGFLPTRGTGVGSTLGKGVQVTLGNCGLHRQRGWAAYLWGVDTIDMLDRFHFTLALIFIGD
jgi:hypothetical protein